ncbi:MAG: glycoside hydrolase family 95 protein [Prevotellaceae bacterium]|jgi:alpha-L-fucosidase 2|nr:glycoside hydrolase family 95 protein [Prevotellaceae bacterium]
MNTKNFTVAILLLAVCAMFVSCKSKEISVNQVPMKWWYSKPADKYWEGLPVGTGRFVAMMPGTVDHELIPFNDETLWTGGPYNPSRSDGVETMKTVRQHAFAHRWMEAHNESKKLFGDPVHLQYYQPMARLNIDYHGHRFEQTENYLRELDMDRGLVNVSYTLDDVKYSRQVFASYPDQVIVYRITASEKAKINLSVWLTSLQPSATTQVEDDMVVMEGTTISEKPREIILPPQMRWRAEARVLKHGGEMAVDDSKISISNANEVVIVLAGATNWVNFNDVSGDEKKRCREYLANASQHPYSDLRNRHIDDYTALFGACKIDLGADPHPKKTTTQAMDTIRKGAIDPAYEARYFHYGRYLMMCGSREGTLAFNNHNPWLDNMDGRWRGRWTLNFNIQVDFWNVENTALQILNESLITFCENLSQSGARTANEMFGCRGWCACHGTDVWFHSAPTDIEPFYGLWMMGGVWLMQQLYDHYEFDPDPEYLKRIYPMMKGAAEFCIDFMVKDTLSGYFVTCPSTSPENSFTDSTRRRLAVSYASASDIQLIRDLFRNCIAAGKTLDADSEMRRTMEQMLAQFPPHKVGKFGQLQEWFYDFEEIEPTHRHIMHLYGIYPDDDLSPQLAPQLVPAVKKVLERRGDWEYLGMFGAWKINIYARLMDAAKSYAILHKMLTEISVHPYEEDSNITPSMEGNQGVPGISAGIAEMLLQSHAQQIALLPALPQQWKKGAVSGLRARGGYTVDIAWENNALAKALIHAKYSGTCRLSTQQPVSVMHNNKEISLTSSDGIVKFDVKAGEKYLIKPL